MIGLRLRRRVGPFDGRLDEAVLQEFADATNERSTLVRSLRAVPPLAMVTQVWEAQEAGRAELVPLDLQLAAVGGVHGQHDLRAHRPIVPGEPLQTWVEGVGAHTKGPNSVITLRYVTLDARGAPVVEQLWTTVWLGVGCDEVGERPPAHSFPETARSRPLGTWTVDVDHEMARRYAAVSGDWSPHHFDVGAARQAGADGPFLHGLCTMALCARGVADVVAGGDPERVRRVAVRFARPLLLGSPMTVNVYDAGSLGCAFEADVDGTPVVTQGRAELR